MTATKAIKKPRPILNWFGTPRIENSGAIRKKLVIRMNISRKYGNVSRSNIYHKLTIQLFAGVAEINFQYNPLRIVSIHGPKITRAMKTANIFGINANVCS